jgi:hypothetical protein
MIIKMRRFLIHLLILVGANSAILAQNVVTVGSSGMEYLRLQEAFDDINAGNLQDEIILQIIDDCFETGTAVLYPSGYLGNSSYSSITIYPTGTGYSISGNLNGPLINLNGAANVIFDGRVDQSGNPDLIITNTNTGTSASTIKFTESATGNIVQYCIIKGSGTGSSAGTIFFSTSSTGSGNDNNAIDNNYITGNAARAVNSLYSEGTSGSENSENVISDNQFYDFLNTGLESSGIYLSSHTTSFTVTGNSFYETISLVPAASTSYYFLRVNNSSGTGFLISGNFIGGNTISCGGSAFTKSNEFDNVFFGIYISAGTGSSSSLQDNTIKNIAWSNASTAEWTGIHIAGGDINAGTVTGNKIGETTGTGSVVATNSSFDGNVYGIQITGTGTVNCQNNIIGSITAANTDATLSTNFYGIFKSGSGNTTINNNIIGSTTSSNSINASCAATGSYAQIVMGINNSGTGNITINANTIANLTNGTTNASGVRRGVINGISSTDGTVTISDNIIRNLSIANANTSNIYQASVCGIALTGITSPKTVTGNTIYDLSNTNSGTSGYNIIGIFHTGSTSPANTISENFIHSFTVSGSAANLYGIRINSGASTYSNNIIFLGGNTTTGIFGIYETGAAGNDNNLYFNSIYIGGLPFSGSKNSYGLYSVGNTNSKNFRNNVIYNARSNNGASGTHYAAYFTATGGTITCDYNDYYVSGTVGVLGYYGGNKVSLPIVTGQDANSFALDPVYTVAGSTTASDYTIGVDLIGVAGTGITTDFGGDPRNNPTVGAWERLVNKWKGSAGTAWNVTGNWTANAIPLENANVIFDDAPANNLYLDAFRTVNNITNGSSYSLVTNGNQLTIKGNLIFTNGAQMDATSSSTTLVFAGALAQQIDAADFVSGKAYNVIIDNTPGVTLVSDFIIDDALTINSGKMLVISAGAQLTVSGTLTNSAGNSGLVIRSTSNGNDGKLVNNTASVPATVKLFISGGTGVSGPAFHYVTPPVASMSIDNSSIAATAADLVLTHFNGDLILYDETKAVANKNAGWQYFDGYGGTTGFTSLVSSRAYNMYLTAGDSITFTGNLNGSAHNFNLTYTGTNPDPGWNLVGNPYPCNYDLSGISALTTSDDGVDNTIYFNNEGGYAYWNPITGGTSGYSDILPPMQGFFVHVTEAGKSLSLPTSAKTGSAALPLRSKGASYEEKEAKSIYVKKVKLALSKGIQTDETIVALIDDATQGFDSDYDAFKLFAGGSTSPSLYSEMGSTKYAINAIREPDEGEHTIIPLRVVIKTAGEHTIGIPEFENLDGTKVVLKHGSNEILLYPGTSYTFSSPLGTFTDFELVIGEEGITTGDEKFSDEKFKAWYSKDFIYINSPSDLSGGMGRMIVYDMQGRSVYNNNQLYIVPGETIQVPANLQKGIYVIHVIVNNQTFVSKVVII